MAPQWLEYVFLIFILMVYETQGDNHERNIFAARVEVSAVSLSFRNIFVLMYMW